MGKYIALIIVLVIVGVMVLPVWYGIIAMQKGSVLASFLMGLLAGGAFTFMVSAFNKAFDSLSHIEQGLEERARMQANLQENAELMQGQTKALLNLLRANNVVGGGKPELPTAGMATNAFNLFGGGTAVGGGRTAVPDDDWESPGVVELD